VETAARAADALGIRWHSVNGARASSDKRRSRAVLAAAGLPSPRFHVQALASPDWTDAIAITAFPCVIKPVGLSGSRGVIRADTPREFALAIERIRRLLARPEIRSARTGLEDEVLIESYIDGAEFAIEGVMTDGRFDRFAMFDKPDPLAGPFFEETIYVTPSRLDVVLHDRISTIVERAAAALGLQHGPIHGECRVAGDDVYVLEVAARPIGGLCSRVLEFESDERAATVDGRGATGEERRASLERVLLEHALGRPIDRWTRERSAAAVMMIPIPTRGLLKGVTGEEAARRVPGVTEVIVTAKTDQLLEPLPEAGSYLGFVFARADTPVAAERAVRDAHAALAFEIEPPIPVRSVSAEA
jgi:biotin carboxylase